MAEPYELEHWRSRALVAEKERDSAKSVLATLRHYFHRQEGQTSLPPCPIATVRSALRGHDKTYWTEEHAFRAVAECIAFGFDDEPAPPAGEGAK